MLASTTLPFLMGTLVENFGELEEIEFIAVSAMDQQDLTC